MLLYSGVGVLIESTSELPFLEGRELFLDFETSSGDPKQSSVNPWWHCHPLGICIAVDDSLPYYVPVNHYDERSNLPLDDVADWLQATMNRTNRWVNHNIKYDVHVARLQYGATYNGELFDTLTHAKLVHSDRFNYSLDVLSRDWCQYDITHHESKMAPYLNGNKDYGAVPTDILGEYGCDDINAVRRLYHVIRERLPEDCQQIADIETAVTPVLTDIEINGLLTDPLMLKIEQFKALNRMVQLEETLHKQVGYAFRPHMNPDCFEVLCGTYGLPVLSYTDAKKPSFDKHTLAIYAGMRDAPHEVIANIREFRHLNTLNNFFLKPYQQLNVDGVLHSTYTQLIRTGRMACKRPNSQQLSKDAKKLILCPDGYTLVSIDYSQIEFRFIVHYCQNETAIAAYNTDAKTDFHQWVADMCGIPRKPAKNINFCIGYGGGKAKVIAMLSADDSLCSDPLLAERTAISVYEEYHRTLPSLRRASDQARNACMARGYVKNIYGRRRHLPMKAAHRAFNTVMQSGAADVMKDSLPRVKAVCDRYGTKIQAVVHDDILFAVPTVELNGTVVDEIVKEMINPSIELRVPLSVSVKKSSTNWGDCD